MSLKNSILAAAFAGAGLSAFPPAAQAAPGDTYECSVTSFLNGPGTDAQYSKINMSKTFEVFFGDDDKLSLESSGPSVKPSLVNFTIVRQTSLGTDAVSIVPVGIETLSIGPILPDQPIVAAVTYQLSVGVSTWFLACPSK